MGLDAKQRLLSALFSRWRPSPSPLGEGYTILMPMPMDMPFLLRFALEGISGMDTTHCRQVVVVPDGWGADGGRSFERVIRSFNDPRIELARLGRFVHVFIHRLQKRRSNRTAANWSHWAMIVEGTSTARCGHAFLHDADAFFIDGDGLERQYAECVSRGMNTLGVQYRTDPYFAQIGYEIPGTWEMMYSVAWARRRPPISLKGQWKDAPHGRHEFDTMLFPQYLDFPTGTIGAMAKPPRLVHFHGTITTYRVYRDRPGQTVSDDLFRLLILSILEELVPGDGSERLLPPPAELARGLDDPTAPVTYLSDRAAREYPAFRKQVDELCEAPTFAGERAARIAGYLRPFDEAMAARASSSATAGSPAAPTDLLRHGLG